MKELKLKNRKYKVILEIDVKTKTIKEGEALVRAELEKHKYDVASVECIHGDRSKSQNDALHLWLSQIEEVAERDGLTVDMWIKKPAEMKITRGLLKDTFRLMGKKMFGKKSTTRLNKLEFSEVVFLFDKLVLERLGVNVEFPNKYLFEIERFLNNNK